MDATNPTSSEQMLAAPFVTKSGLPIGAITAEQWVLIQKRLHSDFALRDAQLIEAASYSMAMVVRSALGLTAQGGKMMTLVTEGLPGCIACAAMRHLVNAGGDGIVVVEGPAQGELEQQLTTLQAMDIPLVTLEELLAAGIDQFLDNCHNIICGLFKPEQPSFRPGLAPVIESLNEHAVPIHCIGAPLGVDTTTGKPDGSSLYASSTLSLGVPLKGLALGADFVGRHYLCDISIPALIYQEYGQQMAATFAEQPVIQINLNATSEQK